MLIIASSICNQRSINREGGIFPPLSNEVNEVNEDKFIQWFVLSIFGIVIVAVVLANIGTIAGHMLKGMLGF